jgi:hypothetical protein
MQNRIELNGQSLEGWICKTSLTIESESGGESLTLDNLSVFVPTLRSGDEWPHPNFLGMQTFLNYVRYAIDPQEDAFYFGP